MDGKRLVRLAGKHAVPCLAAVLTAIAVMAVAVTLERSESARHLQMKRMKVLLKLSALRARIEGALNQKLFLTRGLVAYVSNHPDITQDEFADLARSLIAGESGVRSIDLAKDSVLSHVYPFAPNRAALGLNLLTHPEQGETARRCIELHRTIVAGPVELVQGGVAFIGRTPVFTTPPNGKPYSGPCWGQASILIERAALLAEVGLYDNRPGRYPDLKIAIRGKDELGPKGAVFFGDAAVFNLDPEMQVVKLPGGVWQLAAVPVGGWPYLAPAAWMLRGLGGMLALAAGMLAGFLAQSRLRLRKQVGEATMARDESEEKYRELVQNANSIILRLDAEARITFFNEFAQEFFGFSEAEILGRSGVGTIVPEIESTGRDLRGMIHDLTRRPEQYATNENENMRRNGERVWVAWTNKAIRDQHDRVIGVLCIGSDITARKRAEEALRAARDDLEARVEQRTRELAGVNSDLREEIAERRRSEEALRWSEARYRSLFDDAPVGYHELDVHGRITRVNRTELYMLGYTAEDMVGRDVWDFILEHEQSQRTLAAKMAGTIPGGREFERTYIRKDGTHVPVLIEDHVFLDQEGAITGVRSTIQDITERKRLESQLRALSLRDEMTGLYNRRGFFELAEQQLKSARRTSEGLLLVFADMDHLKRINDALGHVAGDRALAETSEVLRATFRESDIIARIGGDEFAVLAADKADDHAATLVSRLEENLAARNMEPDREYDLSVSVGVVRYSPDDTGAIDDLLARADALMYEEKRRKRKAEGDAAPPG